jgi:hypothetical protein
MEPEDNSKKYLFSWEECFRAARDMPNGAGQKKDWAAAFLERSRAYCEASEHVKQQLRAQDAAEKERLKQELVEILKRQAEEEARKQAEYASIFTRLEHLEGFQARCAKPRLSAADGDCLDRTLPCGEDVSSGEHAALALTPRAEPPSAPLARSLSLRFWLRFRAGFSGLFRP